MERPNDVPEDVWRRAHILATQYSGQKMPHQLAEEICTAILAERERSAVKASCFIIDGHSIHPDISAHELGETTRNIAHSTCQAVAAHIRGDYP